MLNVVDQIPTGFIDAQPHQLQALLGGPTLIHLPGRRSAPLFVSVMLHGNEPTGLMAIQALLRDYEQRQLPRALSIFVGNVSAAAYAKRRLDDQLDYNRIWDMAGDTEEHKMVAQVLADMERREVFASIDIHNNTGLNPHYACINRLGNQFLQMASLFGRTVVYFTKPSSVLSMAFAKYCPSVTLECGQPGQTYGVDHAKEYVDTCLKLAEMPSHAVASHDINVYHTVAIVKVPPELSFGFGDKEVQLRFIEDLDHFNFTELPAGTALGWAVSEEAKLQCSDEHGEDVSERFFSYDEGKIVLARPVMPSMLTLDEEVIRQDCFCYLMERLVMGTVDGSHVVAVEPEV